MFFTPETLATNSRMRGHWAELWANRDQFNLGQRLMVQAYQPTMTPDQLACNAIGGLTRDFWAELDRQVIQMRDQETGMEIVTDLMGVQTVLPIGKTAKLYNVVGGIADDVSISLDGQPPYSFDHTEYDSDGDPIPVFTAGYGVNWRHAAGMQSVGIDLVLDSQAAKLRKFNKKLVSYILDGDSKIKVESYQAQGLRTHRNTIKINLGTDTGGANIDLTSATQTEMSTFFTTGAFGKAARDNFVDAYDILWVSPQIWANLTKPATITLSGTTLLSGGNVLSVIQAFIPARSVKQTFALSGNEFIAYQRRQDVVSPLVGMSTGIVPLPRPLPQSNYNFQIMAAIGLQIKADSDGKSGVLYGADLDS